MKIGPIWAQTAFWLHFFHYYL